MEPYDDTKKINNRDDLLPGPVYTGGIHPNCDYFHGQIPYAKGVHLYQAARANRDHPKEDDGTGHTYKHAPDLTWYHGRFYLQYLTSPEDEHKGAGVSVLASSADGRRWEDFRISFPEYYIPPCEVTDYRGNHHIFDGSRPAFMHQRMAFYLASNDVMLVSGFYGWSPQPWMTNWDNYGVGRVVRRLYPDGSLGNIYFIKINWQGGWKKEDLLFPYWEESPDEELRDACRELLGNPLFVQQWAEENGDSDPVIRVRHPKGGTYQAFCWYHRSEDEVIGLWKHSFVSQSMNGGNTWRQPVKSPTLVMSGQKIWGCRTSDGRFALVYDPTLETQHRFPMCMVTSDDGLHFDGMLLVHGEVPAIRYRGFCKDLGPQYMRGICEGLPRPDGDLYLTYSVNKEDIWFARVPVPVTGTQETDVCEHGFDRQTLREWNLYSPSWSDIRADGGSLVIEDREPYDYARAVRLLPSSARIRVRFSLTIDQLGGDAASPKRGSIQIELCSRHHQTAVRLLFRPDGILNQRTVCELGLGRWKQGEKKEIEIEADCGSFSYTVRIDGKPAADGTGKPQQFRFMAAVNEISEFSLRTGEPRYLADLETNPDNRPEQPLPGCGTKAEPVRMRLHGLEAERLQGSGK